MKIEDGLTPAQRKEQERLETQARDIAHALDRALNPDMIDPRDRERRGTGFALLIFAFGEPPQPATWISNSDREDMIRAVEEWLERAKART
jgi:hypothetical protein